VIVPVLPVDVACEGFPEVLHSCLDRCEVKESFAVGPLSPRLNSQSSIVEIELSRMVFPCQRG